MSHRIWKNKTNGLLFHFMCYILRPHPVHRKIKNDSFEGPMFKKFSGPNDLTRLEGTRRKTKLSLMDDDDGVARKVSWRKPILLYLPHFCSKRRINLGNR